MNHDICIVYIFPLIILWDQSAFAVFCLLYSSDLATVDTADDSGDVCELTEVVACCIHGLRGCSQM